MIAFGIWIECDGPGSLDRMARHFANLEHVMLAGRSVSWRLNARRSEDVCGVEIWSPDLRLGGIRSARDALTVSEAGLRLYDRLASAPSFVYARVAWEPANVPLAEVGQYIATYADGERVLGFSCVFADTEAHKLGPIRGMRGFRPGYMWVPYEGEAVNALDGTDDRALADLRDRLLGDDRTRSGRMCDGS